MKVLLILWILNLIVGLIIYFTSLSFNPVEIYYVQLFILVNIPIFYIWYWKPNRSRTAYILWVAILSNFFVLFGWAFFSLGGPWQTQVIIYRNLKNENRTIEFQMQDVGAFGYNRRSIERLRICGFLEIIDPIDIGNIDTLKWERVDIDLNEMNLKGG
ncbi:MAG: hypothetical protein AAF843_12315 [Bacteroidota bacterium]